MVDFEHPDVVNRPLLRAELLTPQVQVTPGVPALVQLVISNTGPVIDEFEIGVLGVLPEAVVRRPATLALFPDERMEVTLEFTFHPSLAAGEHVALLALSSASGTLEAVEVEVVFEVPVRAAMQLALEPPVRSAKRRAAYDIILDNVGNTPIDALLRAEDADGVLDLQFAPSRLNLRAEQNGYANLVVTGPRRWLGAPIEHTITVTADAGELTETTEARFRQKAWLTPGVLTLLTLALVVLVWAVAMRLGVEFAMAPSDPTKMVPEGFAQGISLTDLDPSMPMVGGSLAGAITAQSTGAGVDRVTVEVFDARGVMVTATATGEDGAWELAGLLPARYRLRLLADGFEERWWPDAPTADGAAQVVATAGAPTDGVDATLPGMAGAIGGEVIAGDGGQSTTVELEALDLLDEQAPIITSTDDSGMWSAEDLPAPATYRITYTAPDFASIEVTQQLGAGQQVVVAPTRLPASPGAIGGMVVDSHGAPVGGVQILAQHGDLEIATTTPTSGEIGRFRFDDLQTPATYLLTFTADGYANETQAVRLDAGQEIDDLQVALSVASGVVTGMVTGPDGAPVGGATVTVIGGEFIQETDTLTSGAVGSYRMSGLPLPGTYTITVSADGMNRVTTEVTLDADEPDAAADVVLASTVGRITGRVFDADSGAPISGVELVVSDGENIRETTSASAPASEVGRFSLSGLTPGVYTITATRPDDGTTTVLREVVGGGTVAVEIRVRAP